AGEAVLTEAGVRLQRGAGHPATIMQAVREGVIQMAFDIETEAASLEVLMGRYSDVRMSLADACLVRLSELHSDCRVLTFDSHFTRYRRHGRQVIPLLMP